MAVDTAQGSSYHNPGGVIYLVAGGGGRGLYGISPNDPLTRSAFSVFHTVAVDVVGDSVYVQAVLPDGRVFDSFSIKKSTTTAAEVAGLSAVPEAEGIRVRWRTTGSSKAQTFYLYHGVSESSATEPVNSGGSIAGGPGYSYLDRNVKPGRAYVYKLGRLGASGHMEFLGVVRAIAGASLRLSVRVPQPDPFDRESELSFALPRASSVRLTVSDVTGRRVRRLIAGNVLPSGNHQARWDGKDERGRRVASGVYFATLEAGGRVARTRLALLR